MDAATFNILIQCADLSIPRNLVAVNTLDIGYSTGYRIQEIGFGFAEVHTFLCVVNLGTRFFVLLVTRTISNQYV